MKKSILAVFSISITAGTIYLGYDFLKQRRIKKLCEDLLALAVVKHLPLKEGDLKPQLEKLYSWDIRLLQKLTSAIANQPDQVNELREKVEVWKVKKRADLRLLQGIIF